MRRHPLAECEKCSLNVKGVAFVPSKRPHGEVELVIVGEAPGYREGRTGIPFTGPSGQLLDAVLRGHGLSRDHAFVTNVCLCRPADNATPSAGNIAACSERFRSECVDATSDGAPILALGNTAAAAVFGHKVTITSFRVGPAKASELYPGTRIVPTVHPAYVLRQQDAFKLLANDVGKLYPKVSIRWEPPTYYVFDEEVQAGLALQELRQRGGDIVFDIETGSEKDIHFVHPNQQRLLCVGLAYAPGKAIVIGDNALASLRANDKRSVVRQGLIEVLGNEDARIVAHNGKFDLSGLRPAGIKAQLGFDTMLASYACDEQQGTHKLGYLGQEFIGMPDWKAEISRYLSKERRSYAHIPREVLYRYNAYDVNGTYLLKDLYDGSMTTDERRIHDLLCRATNTFMYAEMKGLTVDVDYLENHLWEELETHLSNLEDVGARWVNNPRSAPQVKAALGQMGLKVASTNKDVLKILLRRLDPDSEATHFIEWLLEHRRFQKQFSTYVKGMHKRLYRGRLHPSFLFHGTTTGRFSCRNPNLFNIPRDSSIRRMFVPAPGRKFVQADYKGAELRVIACEAKDEYLRQLFADGRDIHNEVATRFFGPGFTKDERVRAKAVVFGLPYGREAHSLAKEHNMPVQDAQKYLDQFFEMIPDTVKWYDSIVDQILHGEDDLTTHFGRHRRIMLITDDNARDVVKEGRAFIPQSTAADICLHATIELAEKHSLDFRLSVYDSVLVECDPQDVEDVSRLMSEVMERVAAEVYSDYVPFEVDVKSGDSWGEL